MPLFKNKEKMKENKKKDIKNTSKEPKPKKIKKKTKIGVKHKDKTSKDELKTEGNLETFTPIYEETIEKTPIEEIKTETLDKNKKILQKKDMKGKPVFLEDTGEKLGIVNESIIDKENNIVGYKIKDHKSDTILSFTLDNFDYNKNGLIFIPGWYNNAKKIIEKLEFKDKISPELTALLSDDAVTNEELYDIFVKHDDEMVNFIDDAKSLREILSSRLKVLEKQRIALKDNLMDLTEKRLIKDIDRKEFSEDVLKHRRKVNILDLNINKCKELISRLDSTSFGFLGKNALLYNENIIHNLNYKPEEKQKTQIIKHEVKTDEFKNKYYNLKEKYNELEQEYHELKSAVDELVRKEAL